MLSCVRTGSSLPITLKLPVGPLMLKSAIIVVVHFLLRAVSCCHTAVNCFQCVHSFTVVDAYMKHDQSLKSCINYDNNDDDDNNLREHDPITMCCLKQIAYFLGAKSLASVFNTFFCSWIFMMS